MCTRGLAEAGVAPNGGRQLPYVFPSKWKVSIQVAKSFSQHAGPGSIHLSWTTLKRGIDWNLTLT